MNDRNIFFLIDRRQSSINFYNMDDPGVVGALTEFIALLINKRDMEAVRVLGDLRQNLRAAQKNAASDWKNRAFAAEIVEQIAADVQNDESRESIMTTARALIRELDRD